MLLGGGLVRRVAFIRPLPVQGVRQLPCRVLVHHAILAVLGVLAVLVFTVGFVAGWLT